MSATRASTPRGKGSRQSSTQQRRAPQKRNLALPIALGLFVLVLAVVAVVATRGGDDDESSTGSDGGSSIEQTRKVAITGTAALPRFDGTPDDAVGATAPVVAGSTFDGAPVTIGQPGEPQLIFFVAHWCPHCQKEVPLIADWIAEEGLPEGISLWGVSTGVNEAAPKYPPSRWLEEEDWPVRTLADDANGSAASAFGLSAYPFFVALDAEGKVVARTSGELSIDQIEDLVAAAKAGP